MRWFTQQVTKDKMENLNKKVNNFFSNIDALASLIFRFGIGVAFIIHGAKKFPLPPQGLIEYFGLSPILASTVALSELLTGLVLIISGFIKNPFGNILTRLSGLNITCLLYTSPSPRDFEASRMPSSA